MRGFECSGTVRGEKKSALHLNKSKDIREQGRKQ